MLEIKFFFMNNDIGFNDFICVFHQVTLGKAAVNDTYIHRTIAKSVKENFLNLLPGEMEYID